MGMVSGWDMVTSKLIGVTVEGPLTGVNGKGCVIEEFVKTESEFVRYFRW